ncbi:hypothetical protein N9383_00880 [Granulosicoccus sp.]|nr:hypothetical protein [Granulosicoccus sp.]
MSAYIFSIGSLRAFNNTQQIPVVFPGDLSQWTIKGDGDAFKLCGNAVCINSASGEYARFIYDIPVETDRWVGVDQLFYELVLTDKPGETTAHSDVSPSFIVARALSAAGKNLRNLGSLIALDDHSQQHVHRRISSFHTHSASLQLVVVVRTAIYAKIADVRFYSVRLSTHYVLLRAIIFSGWIVLLLLLALRVLSHFSKMAQLSTATGFTLLLVTGASQYGSKMTRRLTNWWMTDWGHHFGGIITVSGSPSLAWLHIAFHFMLTTSLGKFTQQVRMSYMQIFAINASIAIGIECVQMAIPERSADIGDLASALIGTAIGILFLWVLIRVKLGPR